MIQITTQKLFRYLPAVIKVGIWLALFCPLLLSSQFFFPFIVFRNLAFRVIVEIVFALWLILVLHNPEYRLKMNKLLWVIFIYFGIIILSSFTGINLAKSWWGDFERMGGVIYSLHLLMYLVVLVGTFKNKRDWHQILIFSLFVSLLITFIGLAQYWKLEFIVKSSGGDRLTATTGNAIYLAAYLLLHLFIILYFWWQARDFDQKFFVKCFLVFDVFLLVAEIFSRLAIGHGWLLTNLFEQGGILSFFVFVHILLAVWWWLGEKVLTTKIILGSLFVFEFFIFWQTQTRGAVIAFVLSLVLFGLVTIFLSPSKKIRLVGGLLTFLIILSPFLVYLSRELPIIKNNGTFNKLLMISATDVTTQSRLLTWQASWQGMLERPILGYGPENYYYVFNKRFPVQIFRDSGSQIWFDRAHNIIFDVGVTTGFIGLALYLAVYIFAIYYLIKVYRVNQKFNESFLLVAALVAFFLQDFFVFDQLNTDIVFFLILGFIIYLINTNLFLVDAPPANNLRPVSAVPLILVLAGLVLIIFQVDYKTYASNQALFQALVAKTREYDQMVVDNFKQAISYQTTGLFEARQQLSNYAMELNTASSDKLEKIFNLVKFVDGELKNSIIAEPLNVRHYLYLASYYNATAKFGVARSQEVIKVLQEALPLSPTRPQIYFELGQAYFNLGQSDQAIAAFKQGVDLAPWALETHFNLLIAYTLTGQDNLGEEEIKKLESLGLPIYSESNLERLIALYNQVKNWPKVIGYLTKLIELNPQRGESYTRLAAVYLEIKQYDQAIKAATQAAELEPSLSEQANKFIIQVEEARKSALSGKKLK